MLNPQTNDCCFFTQQIYLIGTNNPDGTIDFAPISWISFAYGNPCCLVISIGSDKQTKRNIIREGILSATVLTEDLLEFCEKCNSKDKTALFDSMKDKFEKGKVLNVPLIKDAKFSYELRVVKTVEYGLSHTFFAEFVNVNVREDINKLDFYDLQVIKPVIYSPYNYFTVGKHLGSIGNLINKEEK